MEKEGEILEIRADFEEYGEQILLDMIPLWNLSDLTEKTSTYPIPCIDQIHYTGSSPSACGRTASI